MTKEERAKFKEMSTEEKETYKAKRKEEAIEAFNKSELEHDYKINDKRVAYEKRGGLSFAWFKFTQLGFWQAIRRWWNKFKHLHPEGAKLIYQVFYFLVFSNGVTIWQYLVMLFLPNLIGEGLAAVEFVWPQAELWTWGDGTKMIFGIFNEPVKYAADGSVLIGGGVGNFIAFEIAVFTAQCINFPLQRNITFKSHGNPWWQALWYFIGWVLISIFVNAVWGFIGPVFSHLITDTKAITDLLKTFITGGLSMIIFFFIFKIIFPEGEAKKKEEN